MNDEYYMNIALKEAKKAEKKGEVPVGVVIVYKNKIITKTHNKKHITNIVTNHAEIIAINKANKKLKNWRLSECVMYVTLEPCSMCLCTIRQARIKKVVYGTESQNSVDKKICSIIKKEMNVEITGPILESDCSSIVRNFFSKRR